MEVDAQGASDCVCLTLGQQFALLRVLLDEFLLIDLQVVIFGPVDGQDVEILALELAQLGSTQFHVVEDDAEDEHSNVVVLLVLHSPCVLDRR